jgi:NADH-quinone oxidoreductase subunit L
LVTATDEHVVDAAVEGTGTTTTRLGGVLTTAHRVPLPTAAVFLFLGVLVLGVVALWSGSGA